MASCNDLFIALKWVVLLLCNPTSCP